MSADDYMQEVASVFPLYFTDLRSFAIATLIPSYMMNILLYRRCTHYFYLVIIASLACLLHFITKWKQGIYILSTAKKKRNSTFPCGKAMFLC